MTDEQIKGITFKCISHLAMADRHITEYEAQNVPFDLIWLSCTPVEPYFDEPTPQEYKKRKAFCRFNLDGVIYKSWKQLKEALREIEI